MPRSFRTRASGLRLALTVTGIALAAGFSGLVACSKTSTEQATETAASAASGVESAAASVGSDASSMVSSASSSMAANAAQDFVTKAGTANMFEIQTSQLALTTSKDKAVLAFAKMMVKDHTAAGKKLDAALAKDSTANLTAPTALTDDQQAKLDDLKTRTGNDFDKKYADLQKGAHDDAVGLFSDYAKNGTDSTLETFASDTLPTLKMHQAKVKDLNP